MSIGRRPTFEAGDEGDLVVEVHLPDRSEDLYGRDLEVRFVERLRAQKAFASERELSAQIARDVEAGRQALAGDAGSA